MTRTGKGTDEGSLASARNRSLLAAIPDLIIYLSPAGVAEGFHASEANALPIPPERFLGKSLEEFIPVEAAEETRLAMNVAREGGAVQVVNHDMTGPDGSTLHIEARIAWTTLDEFVVIVRDVTERQRQEHRLRRSERLAAMGSLLSGVAHELSNPLTAIQNFTELLLREPRSPEDREAMEIMRREARRAAKLVSELRMMTPRGNLSSDSDCERVDINDVINHVLAVRAHALRTLNIEVRFDPQEGLPSVLAEGSGLEQVFLNLVVNAEYALEQSTPPRALHITSSLVEGGVRVEVEDNGPGLPSEVSDRVFDPFFTTKPPGEGTGLGLAISFRAVSAHGGTIHVSGARLGGARFTVWLPAGSGSNPSLPGPEGGWSGRPGTEDAETDEEALGALRILVVDDEPSIRRALHRYFTRLGHSVTAAEDGGRALELLGQGSATGGYDVVLSDLHMPGTTGAELIVALQARGNDHADRCILMTRNASGCEVTRAVRALGAPVVLKPFDLDQVRREVERVATGAARAEREREPRVPGATSSSGEHAGKGPSG